MTETPLPDLPTLPDADPGAEPGAGDDAPGLLALPPPPASSAAGEDDLDNLGDETEIRDKTTVKVTRQQLVEYLNLQVWFREGCVALPFTLCLWIVFILLVVIHAHIEVSFQVKDAITQRLELVEAHPVMGVAGRKVPLRAKEKERPATCQCACVAYNASDPGKVAPSACGVGVRERPDVFGFRGQMPHNIVHELRSASEAYTQMKDIAEVARGGGPDSDRAQVVNRFRTAMSANDPSPDTSAEGSAPRAGRTQYKEIEEAGQTKMRWDDLMTVDDVWFWIQHGLLPDLWAESKDKQVPLVNVSKLIEVAAGREDGAPYHQSAGAGWEAGGLTAAEQALAAANGGADASKWAEVQKCRAGMEDPKLEAANAVVERRRMELYGVKVDGGRPGQVMLYNQVIGGVRMRQRRVREKDCGMEDALEDFYGRRCHDLADPLTSGFGPGSKMDVAGFVPAQGQAFGVFDYYLDIERPLSVAVDSVQYLLKKEGWLDAASHELQLQVALLNAEVRTLGLVRVTFTFQRGGKLQKSTDVRTVTANMYPTLFHALPDFLWLFLILILFQQEGRQVYKSFMEGEIVFYFEDFWNLVDWVTITMGWGIGLFWMFVVRMTTALADQISELPSAPPPDAPTEEIEAYHAAWGKAMDDIELLFERKMWHRLCLFWYTMVLMLRFFKAFQAQPRLAQMNHTLKAAFKDIVHFLVIFFVLFMNFALGGYVIFGAVFWEWSSPMKAVNTTFKTMMGNLDLFYEMYDNAPVSTTIWFWLFMISMVFMLMNMFLAVIFDHYSMVKFKGGSSTGLMDQFKDSIREARWNFNWWKHCKETGQVRAFDCEHLVEALLEEMRTSATTKAKARQSVLGLKMARREQEAVAFSEGVDPAKSGSAAQNEMLDQAKLIQELGLEPEVAVHLLEKCWRNMHKDQDAHDTRLGQMRDIVTSVDRHIDGMRDCCSQLEDTMLSSMERLQNRVRELERGTHETLAELVHQGQGQGISVSGADVGGMTHSGAWVRVAAHISAMTAISGGAGGDGASGGPSPGGSASPATRKSLATSKWSKARSSTAFGIAGSKKRATNRTAGSG